MGNYKFMVNQNLHLLQACAPQVKSAKEEYATVVLGFPSDSLFFFLGLHLPYMEVSRLGVELEL